MISFMKSWLGLFRRKAADAVSAPCDGFDLIDELNSAIRIGDTEAARSALERGAAIGSCTWDDEGFHTPAELAKSWGRTEIVELIHATRLRRRRSELESLD